MVTIWLFHIAMENHDFLKVNHLFLWAIYTMAMLNNQRVPAGTVFRSQWEQFTQHVALPETSPATGMKIWGQPPVNIEKAIENGHRNSEFSH